MHGYDEIIIHSPQNLFPVQIEDAMTRHPAILEAAAVAVPDAHFGEVVGAWVVRQPNGIISREDVRRSVSDNMNPQVGPPSAISSSFPHSQSWGMSQNSPAWVWFVGEEGAPEELPKTASGKVMKHILRKWSGDLAKRHVGRTT